MSHFFFENLLIFGSFEGKKQKFYRLLKDILGNVPKIEHSTENYLCEGLRVLEISSVKTSFVINLEFD